MAKASFPQKIPAAAVCLLVLLLATACGKESSTTAQGYVEGEYVYVASPYGGKLEELHIRRGEDITTGLSLFRLEAVEERAALARAEQQLAAEQAKLADMRQGKRPDELDVLKAQLAQAKAAENRSARQRKRDEAQFTAGAISQAELDQSRATHTADSERVRELTGQLAVGKLPAREDQITAQAAAVESAQASLGQARWQLAQKEPQAAQGGLVVDTLYRIGEWVAPGSPVVKLLPPGNIKIRFFVPEPILAQISLGQQIQIRIDGRDAPVPATITYVGNEAEYTPPVIYSNETRNKLIFLVEAHPAPQDARQLHPGQPVAVVLP